MKKHQCFSLSPLAIACLVASYGLSTQAQENETSSRSNAIEEIIVTPKPSGRTAIYNCF
jgi:hypothetical protein